MKPPTREEIKKAHDNVSRLIRHERKQADFNPMTTDFAYIVGVMRTLCWVLGHRDSDYLTRLTAPDPTTT